MIPTPFIGQLLWIPMLSLLAYCPILCYFDIRYREIANWVWVPLLVVNVPITIYLYAIQVYPWYALVVSAILCAFWYAIMRLRVIEGADFLFLSFISLFFIENMIPYDHGIMAFPFMIFLICTLSITAIWLATYNIFKRNELCVKCDGGLPMMLPICAAVVLAVMYG